MTQRLLAKALKDLPEIGAKKDEEIILTPRWCLGGLWTVVHDGKDVTLKDERMEDADIQPLMEARTP